MNLTGSRRQQIVAAHDLGHALRGVIDHHGKVVRGDAIVASQHDVVDQPGSRSVNDIVEHDLFAIGAQPQCWRPSVALSLRTLGASEVTAGPRIRTGWTVRRVRGRFDLLADLAARAETLVDEIACGEVVDRRVIPLEALALANNGTVPVDAERGEVGELRSFGVDARLMTIEVFHPDDEVVAPRSGRQPCDRCGPQIAEVQVAGRGGSESTGHVDSVADRRGDRRTIFYSRVMQCPRCGIEVSEHQKFCHECGTDLSTVITDDLDTQPIALTEPIADTEPLADTEPVEVTEPIADTEPLAVIEPVEVIAQTSSEVFPPPVTAEMPAVFDGHEDLTDYPTQREPFQIRAVFLLAIFGAAAMLMAIVADVIDLRTTRPTPGIVTGPQSLDDLGSNLAVAGFVGTAVMVIGGLLTCFGLRWGAGLAGGAGLAVAGWAGLSIGLAEFPIAVAESITRTSSVQFTLRVTRDLGWWLIVGIGVVGLIVFFASLRSIGSGGRRALNPLVAAIAAVAMVVLAFGPLVPVNDAVFADNFRSVDPSRDLPSAFFAGRLGQVALIALAGVVGMLIVRSYGLGLAAGAVSVPFWLWFTSLGEIGPNPVGIADRNPGAVNTVPHAVTTVGMVGTLALLAVAAALATYRLTQSK